MPEDQDYGAAEYLGHQLLLQHQAKRGWISRSAFHKLWTSTAHYLEEEHGCDVELPYFWYKYGEMADEGLINDGFLNAPWGGLAYSPVYEVDNHSFDISEKAKSVVDQAVSWSVSRFGDRGVQYLKEYQYKVHAPNAFIRAYSEFT